jgi:hypothetical protein
MRMVRRASRALGLLVLLLVACAPPPDKETAASDRRAVEIADRVMAALGGKERWDSLRILRWTFEVAVNDTLRPARRHSWDKHTGWHRVEGTTAAGQPFCYIENLNDSTGMAWVSGNPIEGDSLKKLMRRAHGQWINDSYWFLMPYKLRDPGVTLKYEGELKDSTGAVYDRLALSFDNVGMTPGDRYWVHVNRVNHRVERWEHQLEGAQPPPAAWTWEGWEAHDGLWFPTAHRSPGRTLYTRAVQTASEPGPNEFTAP